MEAFCSPLIHTLPHYFHLCEWTPCTELKSLCGKRRRRRRGRRKRHVWLHPSTSDFRSCWDRDQTSHESQALQMELCHLSTWEIEANAWQSYSPSTATVSLITKIVQFYYLTEKTLNIMSCKLSSSLSGPCYPTQNSQQSSVITLTNRCVCCATQCCWSCYSLWDQHIIKQPFSYCVCITPPWVCVPTDRFKTGQWILFSSSSWGRTLSNLLQV